ncbi:MAG: hypothetical protein GXY34_15195 [Syntrophomonadaceae bacterium]|nr:hypothetical protein [Syntrophomonadaceae bacterium]
MRKFWISSLIVVAIMVLFTGCLPPSQADIERAIRETQSAQKTLFPSPTKTAKPTAQICNIELDMKKEWKTIFCDTFENNKNQWWIGNDLDMGLSTSISNGKYIIDYSSKNATGYKSGFYTALNFADAQDYIITITGEIKSNYKNCNWGIIVRGDYLNGYEFSIDNQGNYFLTYVGPTANDFIGNLKYGSHSAIRWDRPNTITAIIEGKNLSFFVNDEPIITYESDNAMNKEISWSVWAAEGVSAIYELDDLLIREK